MKKRAATNAKAGKAHDLRPQYRFDCSKSRPNRFAAEATKGGMAVFLEEDIAEVFQTPESVKNVLRALMAAMPSRKSREAEMGNNIEELPKHSTASALRETLLKHYQLLYSGNPEWSWDFKPSIPFIGEEYMRGKGLLVYASAENLTWMHRKPIPARFTSQAAWDRYRADYEEEGCNSRDFFPIVGIQPVNDGGLLAAALYLADRLGMPSTGEPRTFLETIAVTNWCKFTIHSDKNTGYSNTERLMFSLPFVVAELEVLRPAVVLLPQKIWEKPRFSAAMRDASPGSLFIPALQSHTTVVNCILKRYADAADVLRRDFEGTPLYEWMEQLRGFNHRNAWRYIVSLRDLCGSMQERNVHEAPIPGARSSIDRGQGVRT